MYNFRPDLLCMSKIIYIRNKTTGIVSAAQTFALMGEPG